MNVLFMFILLFLKKRYDEILFLEMSKNLSNCLNRSIDDQKITIMQRMNENRIKILKRFKKQ
jgi:hypothetical protein